MGNEVYANGREVSCKAAAGKSICAFPDVCMTPPQTPATPPGVPIPYPNTGMASDCTDGSKNVKISGKEALLKDKSYFKKSMGDEAGCAPMKSVITHKIQGKVYFIAWSMDVKFEGENVVRHLDMTTHNHASQTGATPPMCYQDLAAFGNPDKCKKETSEAKTHCLPGKFKAVGKGKRQRKHRVNCSKECKKAMECILVPKGKDKEMCCSPNNTGHHLIEDHWVKGQPGFKHLSKKPGGEYNGAPTMCANGSRFHGKHGIAHGTSGVLEDAKIGKSFPYADAKKIALQAHKDANPKSNCEACIEAQLDAFYGPGGSKKCHTPDQKQSLKPRQRAAAIKRLAQVP